MLPFLGSTGSSANRVVNSSNDGVFANLAAKPERGEKSEDLPPVCISFCFSFFLSFFLSFYFFSPMV